MPREAPVAGVTPPTADAVRPIQARPTSGLTRITEAAHLLEQADQLLEEVISAAVAAGHSPHDIDAALWGSTHDAKQPQASKPAITPAADDDGAAPGG